MRVGDWLVSLYPRLQYEGEAKNLARLMDMDSHIASTDLSVVATARNDDHGGNLLHRMQLFVNGLLEQCQRHQLKAELVLVEWNPPPDRPRLGEALSWPADRGPCTVRIIEVPPEIHKRFKFSDVLPLFQMIAKNVGIRRSGGKFVLATNIDVLFPDELMRFLASGRLREGRMYRVDRYDVLPAGIPSDAPLEAQLEYCRQNVIRINAREGAYNLQTGQFHWIYRENWLVKLHERLQDWGLIPITTRCQLHTNACGDFTLMAREHWFDLRGYAEFEMFSLHLDSLLCFVAHHGGALEELLPDPMRAYHIEHATGSGWDPARYGRLYERLSEAGIPRLEFDQLDAWAIQMRRERKPLIFNDEGWGLAGESLPETTI
jgi:hypothetical protein